MATHDIQANSISTNEGNLLVIDIAEYLTAYTLEELPDEALITKRLAQLIAFDVIGGGGLPPIEIPILDGSDYPLEYDFSTYSIDYGKTPSYQFEQVLTSTTGKTINDAWVEYEKDIDGNITTLFIYGHDNGDGTTIDDLILIIKK